MKTRLIFLLFALLFLAVVSCETSVQKQAEESPTPIDQTPYLERGRHITSSTFAALSGRLQSAMKEGGVSNAVAYCNLAAYPLVDSLSEIHQADIRRTSIKWRNKENAPTPEENAVLEEYQKRIQSGEALAPIVQAADEQTVAFYAPIQINAFCLQCHGKVGDTLREEDYAVIQQLYPDDRAVGYVEGDLRGIWSIRFEKK